jgi:uncharacterized protein YihD (DUF1040 family)
VSGHPNKRRRARDPERIDNILSLVRSVWKNHPDMRLAQLLCNLLDPDPNRLFYIEDERLIAALEEMMETGDWPTSRR